MLVSTSLVFLSYFAQSADKTAGAHVSDDCLAELDFREKGGYARNVIDVELVDDSAYATAAGTVEEETVDENAAAF